MYVCRFSLFFSTKRHPFSFTGKSSEDVMDFLKILFCFGLFVCLFVCFGQPYNGTYKWLDFHPGQKDLNIGACLDLLFFLTFRGSFSDAPATQNTISLLHLYVVLSHELSNIHHCVADISSPTCISHTEPILELVLDRGNDTGGSRP